MNQIVRKHGGKTYYLNSSAQYHVKNDAEGRKFVKNLRKNLNFEHYEIVVRGRGSRHPGSYYRIPDLPLNDPLCVQIAVYIKRKPVAQSVVRKQRYWLTCAKKVKANPEWKRKPKPMLSEIRDEQNTSVRMAMIACYGLDKYFAVSQATIVDSSNGYDLLDMTVIDDNLRVLKMICPSTGTVYIHCVPNWIERIDHALDWMFEVTDYRKGLVAEA